MLLMTHKYSLSSTIVQSPLSFLKCKSPVYTFRNRLVEDPKSTELSAPGIIDPEVTMFPPNSVTPPAAVCLSLTFELPETKKVTSVGTVGFAWFAKSGLNTAFPC